MYFACSPADGTIVNATRSERYEHKIYGTALRQPDSVVVITTSYGLGGLGIESR